MNDDDIQYLDKALDNENNASIINLTYHKKINQKIDIMQELNLSKKEFKEILSKLEYYKYVDELPELIEGRYLRWIKLTDPENVKLYNGGILCEIKIEDDIILVLKNYCNQFFQINFEENLIFQKLSEQEKIILYATSYINKSN